jgi:hypothetical protein
MAIHRWTGRFFLFGVAMGVTGAIGLSATTTFGWGFGVGLMGLASAWLITSSVTYYTISKGLVALHSTGAASRNLLQGRGRRSQPC